MNQRQIRLESRFTVFLSDKELYQFAERVKERMDFLLKTEDWSNYCSSYNEKDEIDEDNVWKLANKFACEEVFDEMIEEAEECYEC